MSNAKSCAPTPRPAHIWRTDNDTCQQAISGSCQSGACLENSEGMTCEKSQRKYGCLDFIWHNLEHLSFIKTLTINQPEGINQMVNVLRVMFGLIIFHQL